MKTNGPNNAFIRSSKLIAYLGLLILFIITFLPVMIRLVQFWISSEDNSHGLLIVPVSLYVVWQKWDQIKKVEFTPGAGGALIMAFSILFYGVSYYAEIVTLINFSMIVTIWAIIWMLFGKELFRLLVFPLLLLLLMIPVPSQLYSVATIPLQLLVSKASAFIVKVLGAPIYREGNVLHLPEHTLAVVRACSGLRSLMSLITLSIIFAYMTLSSNIARAFLIISSVPAAIIVNIVRVVIMLVTLYFLNLDLTKGMLHTVFGVIIFLMALSIVVIIRGMLSKWDLKSNIV